MSHKPAQEHAEELEALRRELAEAREGRAVAEAAAEKSEKAAADYAERYAKATQQDHNAASLLRVMDVGEEELRQANEEGGHDRDHDHNNGHIPGAAVPRPLAFDAARAGVAESNSVTVAMQKVATDNCNDTLGVTADGGACLPEESKEFLSELMKGYHNAALAGAKLERGLETLVKNWGAAVSTRDLMAMLLRKEIPTVVYKKTQGELANMICRGLSFKIVLYDLALSDEPGREMLDFAYGMLWKSLGGSKQLAMLGGYLAFKATISKNNIHQQPFVPSEVAYARRGDNVTEGRGRGFGDAHRGRAAFRGRAGSSAGRGGGNVPAATSGDGTPAQRGGRGGRGAGQ
jgi:hypothetical protein